MIVVSVISSSSGRRRRSTSRAAAATSSGKSQIDELAAGDVDGDGELAGPPSRHALHWPSAASRTYRVSARISPVCSASGMNSSGPSRPCRGCCQRTSASTVRTSPVASVGLRLVVDDELVALEARAAAR